MTPQNHFTLPSPTYAAAILEWKTATPQERNSACAQFMPASEVNPLHLRYTDTPGGAWDLVERMVSEGWDVSVDRKGEATLVMAERNGNRFGINLQIPMPSAVGIVFLEAHGIPTGMIFPSLVA